MRALACLLASSAVALAACGHEPILWENESELKGGTEKVTICHRTHSKKNPIVTITVSVSALPAHQAHGDNVGCCPGDESPECGGGGGGGVCVDAGVTCSLDTDCCEYGIGFRCLPDDGRGHTYCGKPEA